MTTKEPYVSKEEKEVLIDLIQPHLEIIRSTAKDTPMCIKKAEAWQKIEKEFNESEHKKCQRPAEKLKKIWKNMAQDAKSRSSENKQLSRKTGGGPAPCDLDTQTQKVLDALGDTVLPLDNPFDNDKDQHGSDVILCSNSKLEDEEPTPRKKIKGNYMIGRRNRTSSPGITTPKFSEGILEHMEQRRKEHEMKLEEHNLKMEVLNAQKIYWEKKLEMEIRNQQVTITTPILLNSDCNGILSFESDLKQSVSQ